MQHDPAREFEHLGGGTAEQHFDEPDPTLLEAFPAPSSQGELAHDSIEQTIEISVPEFTCVCPITGQPDFATIVIRYRPREACVESKSLKLYTMSYRNYGEFHEAAVQRICSDLVALLDPAWLEVRGEFRPRGGITFWPVSRYERSAA